ncbi:hypothetical protein [Undibacterium sp. WLHG33]|uniref:hypothetical protein n=1 Tax=Undibacterium sp. WLHG33 TaxID=3412482 RepID=UPI003C30CA3B
MKTLTIRVCLSFSKAYVQTSTDPSGWTKIFSFMFNVTTIYDSRVAAYINYILVKFHDSLTDDEDKKKLETITEKLLSFSGTQDRARCLNHDRREALGIKLKSSNNTQSFVANKVASWFLRYICTLEYGNQEQTNFRKLDKAMFMLGFDISQIDKNAGFNKTHNKSQQ